MRRLKVFVRKGISGPVYFPITGRAKDGHVVLLKERDWSVFTVKLKGVLHPLITVWGAEADHLFAIQVEEVPDHEHALEMIEMIHTSDWKADHDHLKGVRLPLILHDRFAMVVTDQPGLHLPEEPVCSLERPWLLWVEQNDSEHPAVIATLPV